MRRAILIAAPLLLSLCLAGPALASDYPLFNIMDDASASKLEAQKIRTTADLLKRAATPAKRKALAKKTGLSRGKLTRWVRLCDLMRIKGVGLRMARLLTSVKVATIKDLRKEQPLALSKRVEAANKKDEMTKTPPTAEQLYNWITQAKKLKLVIR